MVGRRPVDLVGELIRIPSEINGSIEALEQLLQCFPGPPLQHGQGVVVVIGDGHTCDRMERTQRDLSAVVDQRGDVRQHKAVAGAELGDYAAWRSSSAAALARFHGSSSSIRLIGCSAMRSITVRRYASGSRPCSFA